MASDPEPSLFFPPLSSLLTGSSRLLSLQTVHDAFSLAPTLAACNETLEKFCYDASTFSLLSSCPDALSRPSAKSKADFEARTAPIQVSGSQNGEYDLEQMKKDALELSGQLGVEESFALRIVVLEWQSRAEEQLVRDGENANKGAELGASVRGKSLRPLNGSINGSVRPEIDFGDDSARRRRQLQIYVAERSSRLKLGADLLGYEASREKPAQAETWMDDLARQLVKERLKLDKDASIADHVFERCMAALDEQLQVLDDTGKLPDVARQSDEEMLMYAAATFNDIVTILRLLLVVLYVRRDTATSSMVLAWFQRLESVNYFITLKPSPAWPDTTELQCLVSLISLTILDASAVVSQLREIYSQSTGGVRYPRLDAAKYIEDENCVRKLNIILYRACISNITIMSPAFFAWAAITRLIRDAAEEHSKIRERMLGDGSSDNEMSGRRRSSRRDSREDMSLFEKLWSALQSVELEPEVREDPFTWFATYATADVFDLVGQMSVSVSSTYIAKFDKSTQHIARTLLLQLLQAGLSITIYGGEILEAILAVLTPSHPTGNANVDDTSSRLCNSFILDDLFRLEILDQALIRYPFELSPTLRLLTSLASAQTTVLDIIQLLDGLKSLTIMVPEHFNAYTLENEEENASEIRLEEDFALFVSRQALAWHGPSHVSRKTLTTGSGEESDRGANVMSVPAGTLAKVLKESRPMVFKLEHAHSGLEYLGLLLSTRLPSSEMCVMPGQHSLDLSTAADIIALINALLNACLDGRLGEQESMLVLGKMSDALPVEMDIVNVVTELFESELLAHLDQTSQEGSLDVLIACAELFATLVKVEPGRLWTAFGRSSLLGFNGGTNALAAVVGGTETAVGHFKFLSACTAIFTHLIDDAIGGLIKRRPTERSARRARFDSPTDKNEYTPERTMQRVLSAFTGVMLEAWESLGEWRFVDPAEKCNVARDICTGFSTLLRATYGLQDRTNLFDEKYRRNEHDRRLTSMLFPSADAILGFFTPATANATSMRSFSVALAGCAAMLATPSGISHCTALVSELESMADFLTRLLRTTREVDRTQNRACGVATQLLRATPDLVTIYTMQCCLRGPVASLLAEVTNSLDSASEQANPPPLLGYLPPYSAKSFISVLAHLDRPLCDLRTERVIWNFLSAVMKGRQQWIALYLLTGSVPNERLGESSAPTITNGKSVLTFALAELSHIKDMPPERSSALLAFVSASQGASVWAANEVRNHTKFLNNIDWLDRLQHSDRLGNTREQVLRTHETRSANLICEILAQAVHSGVEIGDRTPLKMLKGKLNFLSAHGHAVDAYNRSLHVNLSDNFRARFSGVAVETFRRSAANPAEEYGKDWAYDLEIMDQALAHENAWSRDVAPGGRSSGFRDDASRANVNLSLLSAQMSLLKSWTALAATIAENVGSVDEPIQADLRKSLAIAVTNSLQANAAANIDVPGTDKVLVMRAEMGFVLLSKLASGTPTEEIKAVLPVAYRALKASPADFDVATQQEDLHYYRLGLQVLYLATQPHVHAVPKSMAALEASGMKSNVKATDETHISFLDPAVAGVLMDVVIKIVAPVWRALAGNLHTNIACALPADFALITALLQGVLDVPGIECVHTQMAEVVASMQLVRSALSLYSWADHLAEAMGGDPVYGELAVQFLQVLSTVKPVAEHIALEGTLPQLASANLSSYFRKPNGKGPFDEPRRMFTIWAEGVLSLCANLLSAVGPPVAAEVSTFLNGFPLQLERANTALENRNATKFNPHAGAVTLGLVQEAHSLCLISLVLQSDAARAAAEGIDAMSLGGGTLPGYDHKKVVEDGAGLVRQKASLASRITPANGVEAAWASRMVDGVDSVLSAKIIREVKGLAALSADDEHGGSG